MAEPLDQSAIERALGDLPGWIAADHCLEKTFEFEDFAAALAFIERNHDQPFFFYLPYFAPHVPMDATEKYLSRFPGEMPERRRYCLAMMSAIDDGVGQITEALKKHNIEENTLIF